MALWAGTVSRKRKPRCSRGTCSSVSRWTAPSTRRAGFSAGPGGPRKQTYAWKRGSTAILIDRLVSAGHDIEVVPEPYSDVMGHAGAVVLHPDGTMEAAHDPRADGGAAGI
jgi:hypothetical protein